MGGRPRTRPRLAVVHLLMRLSVMLAAAVVAAMGTVHGASKATEGSTEAPPSPSAFFNTRGVRIHYRESSPATDTGSQPALLLIHGFGASSDSWDDVLPLLSPVLPVTRIDLRGFGLSDKPRDANYAPDEQAEIVASFVKSVMRPPVVLVGHSYGGAVALLTYAKLHDSGGADRVAGIVLVDAAAYEQQLPFFVANLRNPATRFFAEHLTTVQWRVRFVLHRLFVDQSKVDTARVERYARYLRLPGGEYALAQVARQIVPSDARDLSPRLKLLDTPTQVIWGERDTVIPLALGERLARDVPGAALDVIPNAGHVPQEEQPASTARVILRFVEGLGARPSVPTHID